LVVSCADARSFIRHEIIRSCRRDLSEAQWPRHIIFVDRLPKTQYGKLDRKRARQEVRTLSFDTMDDLPA
jgi:acyl-CoA synthetase (AMP-forming)/AMP-acid ligase II